MLVYLVRNLVNGKSYVGQTRIGLKKRWRQHLRDTGNGSALPLHRAIRKHGVENFSIDVLFVCSSREEMNAREQWAILAYQTRAHQYGYNVTAGGAGTHGVRGAMTGKHHSAATKAKMRAAKIGGKLSEETIAKLLGRKLSAATKAKMRAANLGRKHSEETKAKLSRMKRGRTYKHSEQSIAKMREIKRNFWKAKRNTPTTL